MNWEQMKDRISSQTISQAIQQLPERLLIYGAGAFGRELFTLLSQEGHYLAYLFGICKMCRKLSKILRRWCCFPL